MIANLEANAGAVPNQIGGTPEECNPKNVILAEELVKILVEEKDKWAYQTGVQVVHFAFAHVANDESTGDFSGKKAECQHVKNRMIDKESAPRLFTDDKARYDNEKEGQNWAQNAGSRYS